MSSPFPGMNPYFEQPGIWPAIHKRLIVAIADALSPQLRPQYRIEIEERVYEPCGEDALLVGIPDHVVVRSPPVTTEPQPANIAVASPPQQPVTVNLPMLTEVREWFLEVRRVGTGDVITVIEILSPANKRPGAGREQYQIKRQKILGSLTHLIEIDLLRQGQIMPMDLGGIQSHYRILVSRSECRPQADLYAFTLQDMIPVIPLPLRTLKGELRPTPQGSLQPSQRTLTDTPSRSEPLIDLQALLHQVYDRGSYDLAIDYTHDPVPALSEADATWMDTLLRKQGLR